MIPGIVASGMRFTAAPIDAYAAAVLALSPVAYWRLNEASGLVYSDSSGNGRSATAAIDASTTTGAGLLSGSTNKAMHLPDLAIKANAGLSYELPLISLQSNWTATTIVKPTGPNAAAAIGALMQFGGTPDSTKHIAEVGVLHAGGGNFRIRVMRSGVAQLFVSPLYAYGTKLHIVVRSSSGNISLWINGTMTNTAVYSYGVELPTYRFGSAFFGTGDRFPFYGVMDEVAMFNYALSDTDIPAIAAFA